MPLKIVLRYAKVTTILLMILVRFVCLRKPRYDNQFLWFLIITEQIL